jgi:hypothetical protein
VQLNEIIPEEFAQALSKKVRIRVYVCGADCHCMLIIKLPQNYKYKEYVYLDYEGVVDI